MFFTRAAFALTIMAFTLPSAFADNSKWGALAVDTEKAERAPYYGVGGGDTEQEASDAAMGFCKEAGGVMCKIMVSYEQCGALAVNGTGTAGWSKAPSKEESERQALSACDDKACEIVVSDCNG